MASRMGGGVDIWQSVGTRGRAGMNDAQRFAALTDIEEIHQLKARYFRLLDTRQWDAFAQVFTEDAEMDVRDDAGEAYGLVKGRDRIVAAIRSGLSGAISVHHGHTPEIELGTGGEARGWWAMADEVRFPDGTGFRGTGHYEDRYRKTAAGWRIASMRLTRLRREDATARD